MGIKVEEENKNKHRETNTEEKKSIKEENVNGKQDSKMKRKKKQKWNSVMMMTDDNDVVGTNGFCIEWKKKKKKTEEEWGRDMNQSVYVQLQQTTVDHFQQKCQQLLQTSSETSRKMKTIIIKQRK